MGYKPTFYRMLDDLFGEQYLEIELRNNSINERRQNEKKTKKDRRVL